MKKKLLFYLVGFFLLSSCDNVQEQKNARELNQFPTFKFVDCTEDSGLAPEIYGIAAHGSAWGDINGDGWLDLFVGVFPYGERTNMLFRNEKGQFKFDDQNESVFKFPTRPTGMVFADFDNDGDLDLYFASMSANMSYEKGNRKNMPDGAVGNSLFENDGNGNFTNVSKSSGACPDSIGGRAVSVLDYNGDGLLDILVGEDPMVGYSGAQTTNSRLFKNIGGLKFEDVSKDVGIPENIPAYGTAVCDVNNDGWPDFFLVCNDGNRLFINDKKGGFYENEELNQLFRWEGAGANANDMVCGVAFGDVNNDGLMDIVLGSHYLFPWVNPQPIRLFLNRGEIDGELYFDEITYQAGLTPLHMKAPHVEIQDFDNDGWPDIYASVVKFKDNIAYPFISRNLGVSSAGIPTFVNEANSMNDFPSFEDINYFIKNKSSDIPSSNMFFEKIIKDKKIIYYASGPTADYDNDGLLDIILPSWWEDDFQTILLRNETVNDNNWLKIKVQGSKGVNSMGIGSRVNIYKAGQLGQPGGFLGCREISVGFGYASGQSPIGHFGLGKTNLVDIEVILPCEKGRIVRKGVNPNQLVTLE